MLWQGLLTTVSLTLCGALFAFVLAVLAALGGMSQYLWLRAFTRCYIEVFRGTSALVQLFWFYYVLPFAGINLDAFLVGVIVLGLNIGAYGSEVVRGAMNSVAQGQQDAAVALNLNKTQYFLLVQWPQAFLIMLPSIGNLMIELLKGTALVSLITLQDLTFKGNVIRDATMQTGQVYLAVLVLYFCIALMLTGTIRTLERRLGRWRPGR